MIKQFYGIKFPFSEESDELTFFDMNESKEDGVKSMLLHIILTPKGQRLRHPNFGTDLIKYVFEPNDDTTWSQIKEDIRKQINFYLPEVIFEDISIVENEDNGMYVEIEYSIENNGIISKNKTLVKL
jgi:phage baseplate assembly protein W